MIDYDEFMGMAYCTIHDLFFNVLLFDHGSLAPRLPAGFIPRPTS